MRASRLLSILMVLQSRGRATADALAEEFEVSVRTIYRDVDELSASGVPVRADRGPGGGFQLNEGYRTQLTGLTPDEADALLFAGLPGPAADLGLGPAMASAERKMLAALPEIHATRAYQSRQRVLLDPLSWNHHVDRPPFLAGVTHAIWSQRCIEIVYESWKEKAIRAVEPFGLVIKAGVWYLVARAGQKLRTYRVSQIAKLKTLDETFTVPVDFNLTRHWTQSLRDFEKSLERGRATIKVAPAAMSRIERLGAAAAATVRNRKPDRHGYRRAIIPIEGIEHAAIELLGFGPHIVVIAPADLVARVAALADEVRRAYESRSRGAAR